MKKLFASYKSNCPGSILKSYNVVRGSHHVSVSLVSGMGSIELAGRRASWRRGRMGQFGQKEEKGGIGGGRNENVRT